MESRLVVLKLPRWRDANADPILLGLGNGFSFGSPFVPILMGRENSFALVFSGFFSGMGGGGGGGGCCGCGICIWVGIGRPGDDCPDRGKTTFAAACAAAA